jgi:L-fucose mutarotase/ribose pyranase (RbsD/FucU family)
MNMDADRQAESWESRFAELLPLFGHRNWIVIADAAYPAQSNPGIETIFTGSEHTDVLKIVLDAIAASNHVRANVYLDAELKSVPESDAPGVTALRQKIANALPANNAREMEHEKIIAKLDEAGRLFRVLVLKSKLALPYTSVFLELDCGYWSADAEKRLRSSIRASDTAGKS